MNKKYRKRSNKNRKRIEFIKQNYIYILWFIYNLRLSMFFFDYVMWYFINRFTPVWHIANFFGINNTKLFLVLLTSTLSIIIALSPTAEKFLRFLEDMRRVETKKEKEYLFPIFYEVRNKILSMKLTNYKVKDIRIYLIDAMYINAYALGRKTVAVTTGAVKSLSEDELKGLIAHEIGHIVYGHTVAVLLSNMANGMFMIPLMISKMVINAIEILHSKYNKRGGLIELIIFLVKMIFEAILFLFVYIGELILSLNSRSNEYMADKFAYKAGYGENLVEALYLIQDMLISDKMNLFSKLKRSHPIIAKRIGALETMIYKAEAE